MHIPTGDEQFMEGCMESITRVYNFSMSVKEIYSFQKLNNGILDESFKDSILEEEDHLHVT